MNMEIVWAMLGAEIGIALSIVVVWSNLLGRISALEDRQRENANVLRSMQDGTMVQVSPAIPEWRSYDIPPLGEVFKSIDKT